MKATTKPGPPKAQKTKPARKKVARRLAAAPPADRPCAAAKPALPAAATSSIPPQPATPAKIFCSAAELAEWNHGLHWLVEDVLVAEQPGVIGGAKKCLKTSFAMDLGVTVALGDQQPRNRFLGKFPCGPPKNVAFISGESGAAATINLLERVCASKGVMPSDVPNLIVATSVRLLHSREGRRQITAELRDRGIELAIIDPLYLALPGIAGDASNLFAMGQALQLVSGCILEAGATPLLLHHCRKGKKPGDTPDLDDLTMCGVGEFARQWILLQREGAFNPKTGGHDLLMAVGGTAGHASRHEVHVEEGVADAQFGGRYWRPTVKS